MHSLEAAFTDGRLLCRLVSLLERRTLPGIEWRQPSPAAAQHNISKVGSWLHAPRRAWPASSLADVTLY